jgi:hypothetical protein
VVVLSPPPNVNGEWTTPLQRKARKTANAATAAVIGNGALCDWSGLASEGGMFISNGASAPPASARSSDR